MRSHFGHLGGDSSWKERQASRRIPPSQSSRRDDKQQASGTQIEAPWIRSIRFRLWKGLVMEGTVLGCSSGVDKQTSGDILVACAAPPFRPSSNCVISTSTTCPSPTLQSTSFYIISRINQSSIVSFRCRSLFGSWF